MDATSQTLLRAIAENDKTLSAAERQKVKQLLNGSHEDSPESASLLLNQKDAAKALGISRITLWRITKERVVQRIQLAPSCYRYRRSDIETIAREGISRARKRVARRLSRPE